MKNIKYFVLLVLFYLQFSWAEPLIHRERNHYGANLGHSFLAEAPLGKEVHTPFGYYRISYAWVEPLANGLNYGEEVNPLNSYLTWRVDAEIAPVYGQIRAELGSHLLPFFEMSVAFRHLQYFASNVEMGMAGETDGRLEVQETWRGPYIKEHLFENNSWDYLQGFELLMRMNFIWKHVHWDTRANISSIDVESGFSGKNYDYHFRIPVYKRDLLISAISDIAIPIGENARWNIHGEGEYIREGWYWGAAAKEPLEELRMRLGALWYPKGREKRHSLLADIGILFRQEEYLRGSWNDRLLLRMNWQYDYGFIAGAED